MADGHADLADLALRQDVVRVVAGLRRQIEGDREAGLPLGEVFAIERVAVLRRRMTGVGPENPGFIALRRLGRHVAIPCSGQSGDFIAAMQYQTDPSPAAGARSAP